jgi:hypothetical protein
MAWVYLISRTALLQGEENVMGISDPAIAVSISNDAITIVVDGYEIVSVYSISNIGKKEDMNCGECNIAEGKYRLKARMNLFKGREDNMTTISAPTTAAVNSINPIHIQFGTLDFEFKIENENNMVPVAPCPIKIEARNFVKRDDGHIMTKPRTALLQGGEDDELMAPQIIPTCNQIQRAEKYYKEYDKLGCDLIEMWRRSASTERGLQTRPNYQIYMGESADKSNSEFSSSPVWNPGVGHMKADAQVVYDIQLGRSWTRWKYKDISFPMGHVSYATKI